MCKILTDSTDQAPIIDAEDWDKGRSADAMAELDPAIVVLVRRDGRASDAGPATYFCALTGFPAIRRSSPRRTASDVRSEAIRQVDSIAADAAKWTVTESLASPCW